MAVVQISKIQVRRGREGVTGIPQLASGEMGWAVDTQKIYIGNGSVAEGAPYVGNTELLTEHSSLLDIAEQYQYKKNDPSVITGVNSLTPISRSVQARLDERVSVASFGAAGDGIVDDTAAIQRALDELYFKGYEVTLEQQRIVLEFAAGVYRITQTLNIPPFAVLQGAGKDKTVIRQDGNFAVFRTVGIVEDGPDSGVFVYAETITDTVGETQARYIEISGITFFATQEQPVGYLLPTKNSTFDNVKFKSTWESGALSVNQIGIVMTAKGGGLIVTCQDNLFTNCDFENLSYCIEADYDISLNTWTDCLFANSGFGFVSEAPGGAGRTTGATNCKFINNRFIHILETAIDIDTGTGNLSSENTFIEVGNAGPVPVINFAQSGNVSSNDYFERSVNSTLDSNVIYIGEVSGSVRADHKFNTSITVTEKLIAIDNVLFRMAAFNTARYHIHYIYKSNVVDVARQGVISLFVDKENNKVHLTDEYDFLSSSSPSLSSYAENLKFTANLANSNNTIEIKYTNQTENDNGLLNFWYNVLS
jgi:hypothetical protein